MKLYSIIKNNIYIMINCVYKVNFYKSTLELSNDYEKLSDYEKDLIFDLNTESFFDYEDELNRYTCYLITSPIDLDKYLKILNNNLIEYEFFDLSQPILRNEIDLEIIEDFLDSTNYFKYDFFMDDLYNWISLNLNIDIVLDRINEVGMDNLREVELNFLKNYNNK
jgi:hypothetical protein